MLTRTLALLLVATFAVSPATRTAAQRTAPARPRAAAATAPTNIPAPEDVLGFHPGDDRKIASWQQTVDYFKRLDRTSDRVQFAELGRTTMDKPFVVATISQPENLRQLEKYKDIQRRLADPRTLGRTNAQRDRAAQRLIREGKTIVLITCGIHSTEVGSSLSSMLIAYRLASSNDPNIQRILRETIILLVPSLNPDGVDIVKNWYDKTLGTPYEGTEPPELYHKYTGHDNNRDWYAFTQKETQLTVDKIHNVWHPQIVHDIHQQGRLGARLFVPPYLPPVEPNVPKEIIEGYTELGRHIAADLRAKGFKGITTDSSYDAWTPARAYSHYHGGVRILSETASASLATPVTVKFDQLNSRSDGFDPRQESANFAPVWSGGEWKLGDITNYMTTAAFALLDHAATNRERWLGRFYELGREAVRPRGRNELQGFVIPMPEDKPFYMSKDNVKNNELTLILRRGGVEVTEARNIVADGKQYPDGSFVVKLAQPYGAFAKALLERQTYPNLRDQNGNPIQPYDVTAHTLPLLQDIPVVPVYRSVSFRPAFPIMTESMIPPRASTGTPPAPTIMLYRSHVPSMDEGWTRWALETEFHSPYGSVTDVDLRADNLAAKYTAIILPDHSPNAILSGYRKGSMPDEYTGGLGAEGVARLREFIEAGGTLVCLNRASNFAIEQFNLPLRDVTRGLKQSDFFVPGSILRTELDTSHPLAAGMPKESIAWFENSPAFELTDQSAASRVRVVASYPRDKSALLSGWILGEERLRGKAALVEVQMGKGRVVLFGFRPQYRGQSLATFPLLFNALK